MKTLEERLLRRVQKTGTCWLWTGATLNTGYGRIKDGKRARLTHRVAYELWKGPLLKGKTFCVMHTCDVRNCVNPDHLVQGTYRENQQDCKRKGRLGARGRPKS